MSISAVIVRRLSALSPLDSEAIAALRAMPEAPPVAAGGQVIGEADPLSPRFIVAGWAARVRWLPDGRRQITRFLLPGDGVGLCSRPQPLALEPVVALTPIRLVDASSILPLAFGSDERCNDSLSHALHLSAAIEEACLLEQIVSLGRRTALERVAHLFLELRYRLRLVGLCEGSEYLAPITQEQLADATGLSAVHVNRTLQLMRHEGLLDFAQGRLTLRRPELLETLADYSEPNVSRWGPIA